MLAKKKEEKKSKYDFFLAPFLNYQSYAFPTNTDLCFLIYVAQQCNIKQPKLEGDIILTFFFSPS